MVIISPKQADPVSDNDSISLTSTIASAHSENDFFEVKRILAENPNSNTATFLIQWEGYPVSRATWEPRKQIRHLRSVINEWRQTQKLEQSGFQESFDTAAWAAAREESEDERQSRKIRRAIKRKRLQRAANPDSDWNLDLKSYEITEKNINDSLNVENKSKNIIKKEPEEKNYVNLLPKSNRNRRKIISDDDDDDESTDFLEQKALNVNFRKSDRPFVSFFQAQPPISTAPVVDKHTSSPQIAVSNQAQEQYPQSSSSPSSPPSSSDESLSQILRRSRALQSSNSTLKTSISPIVKPKTYISKQLSNSNLSKDISTQLSVEHSKLSGAIVNLTQNSPCVSSKISSYPEGLLICNNKNTTVSKDSLEFPQNSTASKGKKTRKRQRQRRKKELSNNANHLQTKSEITKPNHKIKKKRKNKKKKGSDSTFDPDAINQLSDSLNLTIPKNLSPTDAHDETATQTLVEKQRKNCAISEVTMGLENQIITDYNQLEPPYHERTSSFKGDRNIPNHSQDTKTSNLQPKILNRVELYPKNNAEIFSEESRVKELNSIPKDLHQNLHAADSSSRNSLDNDIRPHIEDNQVNKNLNFTEVSHNGNRISHREGSNQQNDKLQPYMNVLTKVSGNEKPDKSLENGRTEMTTTSQLPSVDVNMYQRSLELTSERDLSVSSLSFTTNSQRDAGNRWQGSLPRKTHVLSVNEKMNFAERNPNIGSSPMVSSRASEITRNQSSHNSYELQETSSHPNLKNSSKSKFQSEFSREDLKDYRNKNRYDLVKEVVIGVESLTFIPLNFGNLEMITEKTLKDTIDSVDKIHFNQLCIAQDFQSQYCLIKSPVIWQENLTIVDPNDRDTIKKIEMVFNELVIRCAGLLAVINKFVILMFPVRREEWRFIDQSPEISPEFRLRYSIFSDNFFGKHPSLPEVSRDILSQPPSLSYEAKKLLIVRLLGQFMHRYETFSFCNYYLLFPPSTSQMANFVKSCLFSHNPNDKIYGSMTDGSWDTFNQNQTFAKSNNATEQRILRIVLIHESAITELFRIPKLSNILNNTETTFWQFSDGSSSHSLYPSCYSQPNFKLGNITATELFPYGCAIFLTPSFLVAEPKSAYEFIRWFVAEKIQKQVTPCKFVGAHNLPSYMLDVAKSKASEAASYEKRHAKNPRKKEVLKERFLDYNTCNIRWGLYNELYKLSQCYLNNSGYQDTSECFLLQAPSLINPDNEHELIRWFAAWALLNSDIFRRFLVIGTGLSSTPQAKYLKEFPVKNRESLSSSKTSIPLTSAQMSSEVEGLKKGDPEGKSINKLDTQTSNALGKEKSFDAKIANSIKSLETGINKVSQDISNTTNTIPSNPMNTNVTYNSLVPELGIRILDTTSLDTTQMPRPKPTDSEGKPHNYKEINPYDGNWAGKNSATSKVEDSNISIQQPTIELKELKFEATTEWYQRLKARGSGWEHITITELPEARKLLEFIT